MELIKPADKGNACRLDRKFIPLVVPTPELLVREENTFEGNPRFELLYNIQLKHACALKTHIFHSLHTPIHIR